MPQMQTQNILEGLNTEGMSPSDPRASIISTDPERMGGVPCFAGTRVPVHFLWDYLAGGSSLEVFLDCFPSVARSQAVQAIRLAGASLVEGLLL